MSLDKQIYSVVFQSMGLVTLRVPGLPGFIISLRLIFNLLITPLTYILGCFVCVWFQHQVKVQLQIG